MAVIISIDHNKQKGAVIPDRIEDANLMDVNGIIRNITAIIPASKDRNNLSMEESINSNIATKSITTNITLKRVRSLLSWATLFPLSIPYSCMELAMLRSESRPM
jgi:hypothetical protein